MIAVGLIGSVETLGEPLQQITNLISVLAWPIVVLIVVAALTLTAQGGRFVAALSQRVMTLSAFGVSLELTQEAATTAKATIETTFADYRSNVKREFDRQVAIQNIDGQLRKLVEGFLWDHVPELVREDFRCTIHVPDILFSEAIYQLLDYYPKGGGRGRVFSSRYGIVGATFRSEHDQYRPNVPTEMESLIVRWGMTSQEAAAAGQGRRSFSCFAVGRGEHQPMLGVLYMDTRVENAFGAGQSAVGMTDHVHAGLLQTGLISTLEVLGVAMRQRGPALHILGDQ
jgi:hypothetical protein